VQKLTHTSADASRNSRQGRYLAHLYRKYKDYRRTSNKITASTGQLNNPVNINAVWTKAQTNHKCMCSSKKWII